MPENEVLVLRHQDDAGPGNLATWLSANGIPWELADVSAGTLPAPRRRRALVVLGSREAAYDEGIGWLAGEREFVRASIALGTPVFGICFGAQVLAQVFGGEVRRAATIERGWTAVASSGDDHAGLVDGTWFEWHGDEISPPPTATVLASGLCVQAFRQGPHLGVQFHPEVTQDQLVRWMDSDRRLKLLAEAGGERATLLADTAKHLPDATEAAGRLYARFFGTD